MAPHVHNDLIETLLEKRGITSETREAFLSPRYDHLHSPLLLSDCEIAVERIFRAVENKERIAVYADFDCDGIPGAVIMHDFFKKIEYAEHVEIYIPHRDEEGYGVHTKAIDALSEKKVTLIITIDVGCTAHEAIAHAKTKGIDVIVTDHHECPEILPEAVAVVNPKLGKYPFPDLCGAAVAFKLVQALIAHGSAIKSPAILAIPVGWEKWLLDMVGVATVADVVPLIGENRVLAHFGLIVLRKSRRPGVVALCKKARVTQFRITEDDIAFSIAPRINSVSRVGDPDIAFKLFSTEDVVQAEECAKQIEKWNTQRKASTGVITKSAKERIEQLDIIPDVIVLGSHEWKTSLLGSVASSLVATYGRPVCLWGREGTGNIKGSARSDGTVSMVALLQGAGPAILQSGGHTGAGGYVVNPTLVHELSEHLQRSYVTHKYGELPVAVADTALPFESVTTQLLRALDVLRPFGEGNRHPVFSITDVTFTDVKTFGKQGEHVELHIVSAQGSRIRAFSFFTSEKKLLKGVLASQKVQVSGTVERDSFRGGVPTIKIVSISPLIE